ncbi:MAG: GxxExxY protein [Terrimicrobiaceae bacterium]
MQNEQTYDLAGIVMGLAMKVHRELGPGFLESIYANALALELEEAGLAFQREGALRVLYRGHNVGEFQYDFLVGDDLILELKAVSALNPAHEVQLVNYLAATGIANGLLLNFGTKSLEYKKKIRCLPANSVNFVNSVKASAFTLLELMVSMAVMAVLLVLLLNMVDSATKLWRVNENRVDSYREARAALGIMSRDLNNSLTGATSTNHFLVNDTAFPIISSIGGVLANTNNGGAVFFLSALPAKAQDSARNKSDVCQVGYFLAMNRTSASTNQTLNLYRYFRSSDATFTDLTGNTLFMNPVMGDSGEELLARNVVGLSIRAFTQTNNSLVDFSASTNTPLPDLLELSISAVNQETAKKLDSTIDSWTNTSSPLLQPVVQTFTTRIKLHRPQ